MSFVTVNKGTVTGAFLGACLGVIAAAIGYVQAQAAVRVRPALADVGLIDAALTGHGTDWLMYHHPIVASIPSVLVGAIIVGLVLGWWTE